MKNYKVIDDQRIVMFYKKCTDKKYKSITGIKFPIWGKNKGKMLVPEGLWGRLSVVYLQSNGHMLPKGVKISAKYVEDV